MGSSLRSDDHEAPSPDAPAIDEPVAAAGQSPAEDEAVSESQ